MARATTQTRQRTTASAQGRRGRPARTGRAQAPRQPPGQAAEMLRCAEACRDLAAWCLLQATAPLA